MRKWFFTTVLIALAACAPQPSGTADLSVGVHGDEDGAVGAAMTAGTGPVDVYVSTGGVGASVAVGPGPVRIGVNSGGGWGIGFGGYGFGF